MGTAKNVSVHLHLHLNARNPLANFPNRRRLIHMGNQPRWSQRVSKRIRQAIDASDLTDYRVAVLTGIPNSTFDRRLDGHFPWNTDEIEKIAKVLKISPDDLMPTSRKRAS